MDCQNYFTLYTSKNCFISSLYKCIKQNNPYSTI